MRRPSVLLAAALLAARATAGGVEPAAPTWRAPGLDGPAEVVAYDLSGRALFRWAHLPPVRDLETTGPGRVVVRLENPPVRMELGPGGDVLGQRPPDDEAHEARPAAGRLDVRVTADGPNVKRLGPDGSTLSSFPVPATPTALAAGDGFVFAAFAGLPSPPLPEKRPPFSWYALLAWVVAGLLAAGALIREARRRAALAARFATVTGAGLLLLGSLVLFSGQRRGMADANAAGLWVCLHIIAAGTAVAATPPGPRADRRSRARTAVAAAALALLAALFLGRHLTEVPKNVHNDVGSTVEAARAVVRGERSFFSPGYAEIPGPGGLPTQISLAVFGDTMAGERTGAAALGVAAVLGVFALGREVRNGRTGFIGGILLAGSIPFLHYSRITPFGEVTAYSAWLLWAVTRAARTGRPAAWLAAGVLGGWGFLLFYSARVSLLGAIAAATLLLLRPVREAPRRVGALALFALGAWVAVAPVLPGWLARPNAFFHRMDTSFSLYDPATGFHPEVLTRAVGAPLRQTLAMFWPVLSPERGADLAGQGSMSPALGPLEGILLAAGLALTLADGWGGGLAVVVWSAVMLLGCGVFAHATPWYTRLVPLMAASAVFMARAVDGLVGLVPDRGAARRIAAVAAGGALLSLVAVPSLRAYLRFERERPPTVYTAFRNAAARLPADTRYVCVAYQRDDFSCRHPSFGPFAAAPSGDDVLDPVFLLPVPPGVRTAFLVPYERFVPGALDPDRLVERIRRVHPDARILPVATLPADPGRPLGAVVVVGP